MAILLQRLTAMLTSAILGFLPLFGAAAPNVELNIPFAKASVFQMMDIAFPENCEGITGPVSAVLVVHGGGWIGSRLGHTAEIEDFARRGFVAAAIDHRFFFGKTGYLEMLEDIGLALEELQRQAQLRGLTIKNAAIAGPSSGGHLATLYAFKHHADAPIDIAFCVGMVPPSDFLDPAWWEGGFARKALISLVFGLLLNAPVTEKNIATAYADAARDASPYAHLDADCPPTIFMFAKQDEIVPFSNALRMREKLERLGGQGYEYEFLVFENSGHNMDKDPDIWQQYGVLFEAFAEKYM